MKNNSIRCLVGIVIFAMILVGCRHSDNSTSPEIVEANSVIIDNNGDVNQLLGQFETIARGNILGSIGQYECKYVEALLKHEDKVRPKLVDFLANPDENVAELAAYALGECKKIDGKYYPQIISALDRGVGWTPRALGKINHPKAAQEAVKRYLLAESSPHNQEAYAIECQGIKAVPYIIEAARADAGNNDRVCYLLQHILGEMEETIRNEAGVLIQKAIKEAASTEEKERILCLLTSFKGAGSIIESELMELRVNKPDLEQSVNQALIGIRSKQAGVVYNEMLEDGANVIILRDIAEVGPAAREAGKAVSELLNSQNWDLRLAAARTLGFIGYEQSVPKLIELLSDPTDVTLNWVAAQSLGRLYAKSAIIPLQKISTEHWYPAVRQEAERAIRHIRQSIPYTSSYPNNFAFEYFETFPEQESEDDHLDLDGIEFIQEPEEMKLYEKISPDKINSLSYKAEIITIDAEDAEEQKAEKGEDAIIVVHKDNMVERRTVIDQIPDVALRVNNGWLVGSDRGEWGGELVFIDENGQKDYLVHDNVKDIFKLGSKYIAIAGLAHLMANNGFAYILKSDKEGNWSCECWRRLPGAPQYTGMLKAGGIYIKTYGYGDIVLHEDGTFRMFQEEQR